MKREKVKNQQGSAVVYVLLVVVVLAVVGFGAYRVWHKNHKAVSTTGKPSTTVAATKTATPLGTGTDDQSLSSDVANVNASVSEGTQNLQSATTALNDQNNVVSVPTE